MSKYSDSVDNLAQHTEGFECGIDNYEDALYELSDAEVDAPAPAEEAHVRWNDVPEVNALPEDSAVQFDMVDVEQEPFKESKDEKRENKSYFSMIKKFLKRHWFHIAMLLVAVAVVYAFYTGRIANPFARSATFTLGDSSSFKDLTSSLGANYVSRLR